MKSLFIILSFIPISIFSQEIKFEQQVLAECLPYQLSRSLYQSDFYNKYELNDKMNPFYLRGDFNGDSKIDYAISLVDINNKKTGIAIFTSFDKFTVIGAGNTISNRQMDDFKWMDAWYVYDKENVKMGVGETTKPQLKSDAIMAIKTESASGIIYWNGKEYLWYQQGD